MALGNRLFSALGLLLRGCWSDRKPKLMGHLHQYVTQCLIVDDAHDLSLEYLMFIRELTDQARLHYNYPPWLCLVAVGRGTTIPLKETLNQPDLTWLQFRRRLDKLEPFCRIVRPVYLGTKRLLYTRGGSLLAGREQHVTCQERTLSRRTSRRWFCHTSGVVTGRMLG